jgi:hypothetical protein
MKKKINFQQKDETSHLITLNILLIVFSILRDNLSQKAYERRI